MRSLRPKDKGLRKLVVARLHIESVRLSVAFVEKLFLR